MIVQGISGKVYRDVVPMIFTLDSCKFVVWINNVNTTLAEKSPTVTAVWSLSLKMRLIWHAIALYSGFGQFCIDHVVIFHVTRGDFLDNQQQSKLEKITAIFICLNTFICPSNSNFISSDNTIKFLETNSTQGLVIVTCTAVDISLIHRQFFDRYFRVTLCK